MRARVFGVGEAGADIVSRYVADWPPGMETVAVGVAVGIDGPVRWDLRAPTAVLTIPLSRGGYLCRIPKSAARQGAFCHESEIEAACRGCDLAIVVAEVADGEGAGIAPVIARACKRLGVWVAACAIVPPHCMNRRMADRVTLALAELADTCDAMKRGLDAEAMVAHPPATIGEYWSTQEELTLKTVGTFLDQGIRTVSARYRSSSVARNLTRRG